MTMQQIKYIYELGHEIGGHSMYHDIYTRLKEDKIQKDIKMMMEVFNSNGITISAFAFTDGRYNKEIIEQLIGIGIKKACAIKSKSYTQYNLMELERHFVTMDWQWN